MNPFVVLLSETPSSGQSVTNLLSMATEIFTWIISTVFGKLVDFIFENSGILIFLGLTIVSFGVGMFFRVWYRAKH